MAASSHKQRVQRSFVRIALSTAQHGFTALDQNLVYYSALMTDAYDVWYDSWAKTVQVRQAPPQPQHRLAEVHPKTESMLWQGDELAQQLAADDKAGQLSKELYNHYTIITKGKGGAAKYSQVAYATYFPKEIGAIVAVFDQWLAGECLTPPVHAL